MKQLLKLSLLLLALLLPTTATAYDFEVDGIYYNISGNEATVTYQQYVNYSWQSDYSGDVTIPETVTYNGINFPVTSIGEYAFYGCSGLTSVTIPNTVSTIGYSAFDGTAWYENQPDGVVYLGLVAYKYKGTIPEGTSITLRDGTLGIADGAFAGRSGLTRIDIPNSVTTIGYYAFIYCPDLTSVTIGNSVTTICGDAFGECIGLTSVTIPNSVISIGEGAFSGCYGLTSVTIPNSVTSIGKGAFRSCRLTSIIVEHGNTKFDSRDNCNAIIETASNTLIAGCENTIIPNSVTSIGSQAFYGCFRLTSIDIPNSVTHIGGSAFSECRGLNDVFSFIDDPTIVFMGDDVFYCNPNYYTERTLHVPFGTLSVYQADTKWSRYFGSIVEMEPEPVLAEEIKLNVTTAGLNEGATLQLTATVLPEDCDNKNVIWASNNPSVATVDSNGLVTTHGVGTATITAITADGSNLSTTCTVTLLPVGIKGDVNGDSVIDIDDVTKLINYLLKGSWSN